MYTQTNPNHVILPGAPHPGEMLQEYLEEQEIDLQTLTRSIPENESVFAGFLEGSVNVTPALAESLSQATGIPEIMWLNLQEIHDFNKARTGQKQAV